MRLTFSGAIIHWRGPSPYHFVVVPDEESEAISEIAAGVTYGWGVIPVSVQIGTTRWTTSLFPKDGGYLLPVRDGVRRAEGLQLDDVVDVVMDVGR